MSFEICAKSNNKDIQQGSPSGTEGGATMASKSKSPRHFLRDVFGNSHKEEQQGHATGEPLCTEGGARMASTSKCPSAFFEGCPWKFAQRATTRTFNRGALQHRRWGKDGFNKQVSKAFFEGCPWKFAQRATTSTFNRGALKHRRWGKAGLNKQVSKCIF